MRAPKSATVAIRRMRAIGKLLEPVEKLVTKHGAEGLVLVVVDPDGFTTTIHRQFGEGHTKEERRMRLERVAAVAARRLQNFVDRRTSRERQEGALQ